MYYVQGDGRGGTCLMLLEQYLYMYICTWAARGPSHQSGRPRATKRTAARPAREAAALMRGKSEASTKRRSEILMQW